MSASKARTVKLTITADADPIMLFIKLLTLALKVVKGPIDFGEITSDFVRVESKSVPAPASEVRVTLYPSDRFLCHAAAVFAGKLDLDAIKDIGHE